VQLVLVEPLTVRALPQVSKKMVSLLNLYLKMPVGSRHNLLMRRAIG
jgi:hypothetical protein